MLTPRFVECQPQVPIASIALLITDKAATCMESGWLATLIDPEALLGLVLNMRSKIGGSATITTDIEQARAAVTCVCGPKGSRTPDLLAARKDARRPSVSVDVYLSRSERLSLDRPSVPRSRNRSRNGRIAESVAECLACAARCWGVRMARAQISTSDTRWEPAQQSWVASE